MSQGQFVRSRYEADAGTIHNIRVQPLTLTAVVGGGANSAPTGAVDSPISARSSQSARAFGLRPRQVTLAWSGDPPTGYDDRGTIRIPILTPARFNAINVGATGTYRGAGVTVVGKSPESTR